MRKIYKNNISRIATMEFLIFHKFEFAKFYSFQDTVHDVLVVLLLDEQRRPSYLQRWYRHFWKKRLYWKARVNPSYSKANEEERIKKEKLVNLESTKKLSFKNIKLCQLPIFMKHFCQSLSFLYLNRKHLKFISFILNLQKLLETFLLKL